MLTVVATSLYLTYNGFFFWLWVVCWVLVEVLCVYVCVISWDDGQPSDFILLPLFI